MILFLGDTTDNAKGFLISFDNSAVKPKPILKPRKSVKKDESPVVDNPGKQGSVTSDKMERNMDDIPTEKADYSLSGAILKCRLCEESESNDPTLQLCWSCIQLLKRNPRYLQNMFYRVIYFQGGEGSSYKDLNLVPNTCIFFTT